MLALCYARLSRDDRDEDQLRSGSVERQLAETRERILAAGDTPDREFVDDGISGATLHRPGLDGLLAHVRELRGHGKPVRVWVKNQSRLARDVDLIGYLRTQIRLLGAEVVCWAEEGQPRMVRHVQAIVDEAHVQRCREEAERILPARAREGRWNGGPVPYGFRLVERGPRDKGLIPDPAEAAVVARAFELADPAGANLPLRRIAEELHVRLPRLRYWLRSPVYSGAMVWRRHRHVPGPSGTWAKVRPREEWIVTWGAWEAIVPRDRWDRVQARMDTAATPACRARSGRRMLALSGLLRCGACGEPLRGRGAHETLGGRVYVYGCVSPGCRAIKAVSTAGWTQSVVATVLRALATEEQAAAIARELAAAYQAGRSTGHIEADVRRLERRESTLVHAIASADAGAPALCRELDTTSRALAESRARLQEARSAPAATMTAGQILRRIQAAAERLLALPSATPAIDSAALPLLDALVDAVVVDPSRASGTIRLRPAGLLGLQDQDRQTRRS